MQNFSGFRKVLKFYIDKGMRMFGRNASELMAQAARRQQELKDPALRDDLAAARAVLKKHSMMLLTASKAFVRHPELAAAKANRDYVLKQVCQVSLNYRLVFLESWF